MKLDMFLCFMFLLAVLALTIGLKHAAALLTSEGLKTFVFAHRNSFPNISTPGSGYEIYCLWPIWPPRE